MASVKVIPSIPGELFAKFQTGFYADPVDAMFEAMGKRRVDDGPATGETPGDLGELAQCYVCFPSAWQAADEGTVGYVENWGEGSLKKRFKLYLVDALHDIFGNPFRPVSINSDWLNPTVSNLAQADYEERIMPSGEFDTARLAVLSHALEEAGCDDADILTHLQSPGLHVRAVGQSMSSSIKSDRPNSSRTPMIFSNGYFSTARAGWVFFIPDGVTITLPSSLRMSRVWR